MPPAFTDPNLNAARITQIAQGNYRLLLQALDLCVAFQLWISQFSANDLMNMYGFATVSSAQEIINSATDANNTNTIFNGGAYGGPLPNNFSVSVRQIVGPVANGA